MRESILRLGSNAAAPFLRRIARGKPNLELWLRPPAALGIVTISKRGLGPIRVLVEQTERATRGWISSLDLAAEIDVVL